MNFGGLGTKYCPVLLLFALLLLSGLALRSSVAVSEFAPGGVNQSLLAAVAAHDPVSNRAGVHVDLAQLPLRFEPNEGQTDPRVDFLARGAGYGLFLTADHAVLTLRSSQKSSIVRMQLAGGNPAATVTGASLLPGKSNYFIGNDPAKWHRDIPQFAQVRYQDVYPGVNLAYYGNQGQLEYDFEVAPGADPGQIALRFQGPEKARLDGEGNLILASSNGELTLKAPHIYQMLEAEQKQTVAGRFVLRASGEVGFDVGSYDRRRALVIDPLLTYSTYFGGTGNEACSGLAGIVIAGVTSPPSGCPAVAIDASANIYLAGATTSADFPIVPPATAAPPAFQPTLATPPDVFVAKLNAAGSAIIFSTFPRGQRRGDHCGSGSRFRLQRSCGGYDHLHQLSHDAGIRFSGDPGECRRACLRQ